MTNYESADFDIKNDPRTHVFETPSDTFYIFDAPAILTAVDRGVEVMLDNYSWEKGIVALARYAVKHDTNLRNKPASVYNGKIIYDPDCAVESNPTADFLKNLDSVASKSNLDSSSIYWNNVRMLATSDNKYPQHVSIFSKDKKVSVTNNRLATGSDTPNFSTSITASPISEIDPFTQLTANIMGYGAVIGAIRLLAKDTKERGWRVGHYVTSDGLLYYIDGHYTLKGYPASERVHIITKQTETNTLSQKTQTVQETPMTQTEIPSIEEVEQKVTINDIGGLEEAKQLMRRIATSFNHPEVMDKWGAKRPNGVMLYGPPGTGKTTLARALANEINGELWQINTSEIFEKWIGDSEKNLQHIFDKAKSITTPTVMLWDEFEAIIPNTTSSDSGGSRTQNAVVGLFKQEVEKLYENPNIVLMASTNNVDVIDDSVIRAGRFDEKLYIPLPNEEARKEIWAAKIGPLINWSDEGFSRISSDVDFEQLAVRSDEWSGADITACLQGLLFGKAMAEAEGSEAGPVTQANILAEIEQTNAHRV